MHRYESLFCVVVFAFCMTQEVQGQAKKKDPPAKKSHIDAMNAAMGKGLTEIRKDVDGVKKDVQGVKDDLKKSDGKLDRILAKQLEHDAEFKAIRDKQVEHDAEFKAIRDAQVMLAKQIKEGFDSAATELGEVKKIVQKNVNVTVNVAAPPPVEKVVYKDRVVYQDRIVYQDRVVVQKEYVDRYVHVAVPYRVVGYVPYYDCYGNSLGYYRP